MPRRIFVSATTLAALLAFTGCAAASPAADLSGAPASDGGTLVFGTNGSEPDCIDPHSQSGELAGTITRPIVDSLVWQNEDGSFGPWLATDWEVSDDGLIYTFELRDDVTFQDGTPFDAAAVVANFDAIKDPEYAAGTSRSRLEPVASATAVEDHRVEVTLSYPYSSFLNALATVNVGIVSPTQLADDPDSLCTAPIGTGPFVVDAWTKGVGITYKKSDDYAWGPDADFQRAAHLDGLEVLFISDDAARYRALTAGDVQAIEFVPDQFVEEVEDDDLYTYSSVVRPGHSWKFALNTQAAPFDDVDVRSAFIAAADRDAIVKTVTFDNQTPSSGLLTSTTPFFSDDILSDSLDHDLDEAEKLLDAAGWTERDADGYRVKDGARLTVAFNDNGGKQWVTQIAELLQAQVKEAGFDLEIRTLTAQDATARNQSGDYAITGGYWTNNTADVLSIQYSSSNLPADGSSGFNVSRIADDDVDAALLSARQATDPQEIAAFYAQAHQRLLDLRVALPILDVTATLATDDTVSGISYDYATMNAPFFLEASVSE